MKINTSTKLSKPALYCLLPLAMASCQEKKPSHTNFIIINFDDAGNGDFSHKGAVGYKTPNIDSVASKGVMLTNFYTSQPISGASRAGLMTGCYPNRINIPYGPGPNSSYGIHQNEMTIAELLKQKDYATAIFGKWHLGDSEKFLPLQHGFDQYYGLPHSNDMWPHHPTDKYPDLPLIEGNEIIGYNTDQSQLTTEYTNRSVKFIKENQDKPFFLYLAHTMPHVPLAVSDKFKGKSQQGLYGDVMMELDWSVGEIYKALKEAGLDNNTMVIITSDNGPWASYGNHAGSSGGLREAKQTTFNGGVRIPGIVTFGDKIDRGAYNGLLCNIDIFPTIAQIAGVELPKHTIDGHSFKEQLENINTPSNREALALYFHRNSFEAITDGNYKLVFPHNYVTYEAHLPGQDGQPGYLSFRDIDSLELYDLRRDPSERTNVIEHHPEIVEKLSEIADSIRVELGDDLTGVEGRSRREAGKRD